MALSLETRRNSIREFIALFLSLIFCCVSRTHAFGLHSIVTSSDLHFHLETISNAFPSMLSLSSSAAHLHITETPTFLAATSEASPNVFEIASTMYRQELRNDPLKTKVVTGIFLAVIGDALAQSREPNPYNVKRAVSFATFDGCYRAVQQFTYPPMMQLCSGHFLSSALAAMGVVASTSGAASDQMHLFASIEQTLVSQLVIIPTLYYPVFYAVTGAVQGLTMDQTITRAKDTFVPLMKRNLLFWIPVQFFAFNFVEENLQIPILIVCGLVWTIILSVSAGAVNNKTSPTIDEAAEALLDMQNVVLQDDGAYYVMGSSDNDSSSSRFSDPEREMKNVDIAERLRRRVQPKRKSDQTSDRALQQRK